MGQTIEISDKSAALLAQQAAAHGVTMKAWIEELAVEKALTDEKRQDDGASSCSVVEQMRELRSRVKTDPEDWPVKKYIEFGRR